MNSSWNMTKFTGVSLLCVIQIAIFCITQLKISPITLFRYDVAKMQANNVCTERGKNIGIYLTNNNLSDLKFYKLLPVTQSVNHMFAN